MEGITTFKSREYAQECMKKATDRLVKVQKFLVPSIITTAVWLVAAITADKLNEGFLQTVLSAVALLGVLAAPLVIYTLAGSWFYVWKLITLPWRKIRFVLIAIIVELFWLGLINQVIFMLPVVVLLYERYLCNLTIGCAKDHVPSGNVE